jgi:putative polyhydroxyalkanoate system protein
MIVVRRHHHRGLQAAEQLAESVARRLQKDYGGSYAWKGNDLHFGRPGASGSVAVTKDDFEMCIELGLLLRPLRPLIEREIGAFCDENFGESGAAHQARANGASEPAMHGSRAPSLEPAAPAGLNQVVASRHRLVEGRPGPSPRSSASSAGGPPQR